RGRGPARDDGAEFPRFSLTMEGGLGTLERGRDMLDLKLEAQVGVSRAFRLGLGVGTMNRSRGGRDEMGRDGRGRGMMGGRGMQAGSGMMAGPARGGGEVLQDIRVIPLSLSAYYALPLGRKAGVFMSAGGSYYFGRFDGAAGRQTKNAWGGQAGLGFEYRLTSRVNLLAEGSYRFAEFKGLRTPQPQPMMPFFDSLLAGLRPLLGARGGDFGPLLDGVRRMAMPWVNPRPRPVDFNFNGFSCRAGVKFGI
ncbi:MAG: porin family protein, partial [Candidatus Aminicenantes bacterium]|nr:porin family protein [Candidatus Aminicenantes bacterium]